MIRKALLNTHCSDRIVGRLRRRPAKVPEFVGVYENLVVVEI